MNYCEKWQFVALKSKALDSCVIRLYECNIVRKICFCIIIYILSHAASSHCWAKVSPHGSPWYFDPGTKWTIDIWILIFSNIDTFIKSLYQRQVGQRVHQLNRSPLQFIHDYCCPALRPRRFWRSMRHAKWHDVFFWHCEIRIIFKRVQILNSTPISNS